MQLLEENIGRIHFDTNYCKIFFDQPPGSNKNKQTKIKKWDLIKLNNLCTAKET